MTREYFYHQRVRGRGVTSISRSDGSEGWRLFWGRHRSVVVLFVVAIVLAVLGAVMVFLWYVGQAQLNGTAPMTLGQWTMAAVVTFLLNLIFWEIVLIGVPMIVAAVAFGLWWRRLPFEERQEYRFFHNRSRTRNGGSAFSLLVFIAFCFKVSLDGNWNAPFAGWTVRLPGVFLPHRVGLDTDHHRHPRGHRDRLVDRLRQKKEALGPFRSLLNEES